MAAYAQLSGVPVLDGRMSLPRCGAWTAELRVDANARPKQTALVLELGGVPFLGSAVFAAVHKAVCHVRLVGGAGGLATELPAKGYHSAPLVVPLRDIATEAGERLAGTLDMAVGNVLLPSWARFGAGAGKCLARLLETVPGAAWRFLQDGTLWVGAESWPGASLSLEPTEYFPNHDRLEFVSLAPSLLPGTTLFGRRVSYVEHRVTAARVWSSAWFEVA